MHRRNFLQTGALTALGGPLLVRSAAQQPLQTPPMPPDMQPMPAAPSTAGPAELSGTEFTLQIAPVTVELAPNRIIGTVGYNGTSPGPLLRMKEGVPVTVNVVNDTDVPEYVHFHGLLIPSDVDGSEEEGTPVVPAHGKCSYRFSPTPAGTRWYHTHTMSMDDLHRGSYTGMFGFLIVEGASNPCLLYTSPSPRD